MRLERKCPMCAELILVEARKCRHCMELVTPIEPSELQLDKASNANDLVLKYPGLRVAGQLKDALEEVEKFLILEALKRTGWNKSQTAKELGISRAGLIMKVEKYQLEQHQVAAA